MKWFGRSGGYWLFWTSAIYFVLGIVDLFVYNFIDHFEIVEAIWILVISLPLWIRPLAQQLNMKTIWER